MSGGAGARPGARRAGGVTHGPFLNFCFAGQSLHAPGSTAGGDVVWSRVHGDGILFYAESFAASAAAADALRMLAARKNRHAGGRGGN